MPRSFHEPQGDPCVLCDRPASEHVVEHESLGDPCKRCWLPKSQHRPSRKRKRAAKRDKRRGRGKHHLTKEPKVFIGIDGEGVGRKDHRYVMMARASIGGRRAKHVEAEEGGRLSTIQCLDFILACPKDATVFAFAFNYDLTHILRDLDNDSLYKLLRPQLRLPKNDPRPRHKRFPLPIRWNGYSLNFLSRKFVVEKGDRRTVIWDIFAFFQSKFVKALRNWKIGTPEELDRMEGMKDKRGDFDQLESKSVLEYCFDECAKLAELAKKMIQAHKDAGITLRSYYGAGSTASALLKSWGIDEHKRKTPRPMESAVACAFFGGRFENSVIGTIKGPVYGYDISSAYPYAITFLPCLQCGKWSHTTRLKRVEKAGAAVVRYSLPETKNPYWGPFPFRLSDGSIAFPSRSGGGWVWKDEFLSGLRLFPKVRFHEAWVYESDCDHQPFADVPRLYRERLRIGKEGPGWVFKLGPNSLYGKTAQSVGADPPFQCWIWAGMTTSQCRSQILDLMAQHKSLKSVKMIATDGLYTTEEIETPLPRETGTAGLYPNDDGELVSKPLGGWEKTTNDKGMFAARPGIYFPLGATKDEIKKVRARGIGRAEMFAQSEKVMNAFNAGDPSVKLGNVTRFLGAKNTITKAAGSFNRSPDFGQWKTRELELSFDPLPKRDKIHQSGRLRLRKFPGAESHPYDPANRSVEALALQSVSQELEQQPDGGDWIDYEVSGS